MICRVAGKLLSTSNTQGVGADNHLVVYEGRNGDYYDFSSDSILTVKENDSVFNYDYIITSDSTMALYTTDDRFHTWPIAYSVIDPTMHSVNLINAWQYTPAGVLGRSVYLKRERSWKQGK